jgi:methylation protein EvaC
MSGMAFHTAVRLAWYTAAMQCRICRNDTAEMFLGLGMQPLANKYPKKEDFASEDFFPLQVFFCSVCKNVQLGEIVSRERMFVEYFYLSSVNQGLVRHFEGLAKKLAGSKFVVDVGSNDGILLKPLKELGVKAVGIEPSVNVSKMANDAGLTTITAFFDAESARKTKEQYGASDVIVASSIFTHLENPHAFVEAVKELLTDDGRFIIEVEYIGNFIKSVQFERFYLDRVYYYSLTSLKYLAEMHGMYVADVEHIEPHGGSLQVTMQRIGQGSGESERVKAQLALEKEELTKAHLTVFRERVDFETRALRDLLQRYKNEGKIVAGYGAPARVSTICNYGNIGPDLIAFTVDDSPLKQNKFTPGTHIPVVPKEYLDAHKPDILIVFAYEYLDDIRKKTNDAYRYMLPIPPREIESRVEARAAAPVAGSSFVEEDIRTIADALGGDVHRFAGKTVLISGGAGFLGRYFLGLFRYLNAHVLRQPVRVISVDNYITGSQDSSAHDPNISHVWADVVHPLPVREDIHYIIHAAGIASPVYYMKYPLETIESAVTGVKNLLELARKNKGLEGFLYFSSSEIYGDPDPKAVPTPETYHGYVSSVGPRACYDESKRLGETITTIYNQLYEVPTSVVRPFNIYGPGMGHADRRVVPMFTYQALNKKTIPVHGDGMQTRTFCYISDALTGFVQVLLKGERGHAYNIGNPDSEIAMKDLAQLFTELVPGASHQLIPYPDTYPAGEPQRRCPDLSKAKAHVGYTHNVGLRDGLKRFIAWAETEPGYRAPIERAYVDHAVYKSRTF